MTNTLNRFFRCILMTLALLAFKWGWTQNATTTYEWDRYYVFEVNDQYSGTDCMKKDIYSFQHVTDSQMRWEYLGDVGITLDHNTVHSQTLSVRFYSPGDYLFSFVNVSKYSTVRYNYVIHVLEQPIINVLRVNSECWHPGDPLSESDFVFQTLPDGYEPYIVLDQHTVPNSRNGIDMETVTYHIEKDGKVYNSDDYLTKIWVVNENIDIMSLSLQFNSDTKKNCVQGIKELKKAAQTIREIKRWGDLMGSYTDVLARVKQCSPLVRPIDPDLVNVDLDFNLYGECCNDCLSTRLHTQVSADIVFFGVTVDVPVPYLSIPGVGGLMVSGEAKLGAKFPVLLFDIGKESCFSNSFSLPFYLSIDFGVIVAVINRDILSAGGFIQTDAQLSLNCLPKSPYIKPDWENAIKVYAKIEARVIGFNIDVQKWLIYPTLKNVTENN